MNQERKLLKWVVDRCESQCIKTDDDGWLWLDQGQSKIVWEGKWENKMKKRKTRGIRWFWSSKLVSARILANEMQASRHSLYPTMIILSSLVSHHLFENHSFLHQTSSEPVIHQLSRFHLLVVTSMCHVIWTKESFDRHLPPYDLRSSKAEGKLSVHLGWHCSSQAIRYGVPIQHFGASNPFVDDD